MLSHGLKCRKNEETKNTKAARTKSRRIMLSPKYAVCDSKKLKFRKEQETKGLLSSVGLKIPLIHISLLGPLLF